MKTKMILMLVFLSFASASVTAANPRPINDKLLIVQTEIQKILQKYPHQFAIEEDYVVYVEITMNDNNEIIVLEMDCEDKEITQYIRNTLNYKKIKGGLQKGLPKYVVPLRFEKKVAI